MEFDPTNSHQNSHKPTNRALFRRGFEQESFYSDRMKSSHIPSNSDTQRIKKMKFDSTESELIRSVVTGQVSVQSSYTALHETSSSKNPLLNMIGSTQTTTMSTIENPSIHNGNFTDFSQQPSVSTIASLNEEEMIHSGKRSTGFTSFLKPSTTTAMPGRDEETVYNGKKGGIFMFLKESMVSFEDQSSREGEKTVERGKNRPLKRRILEEPDKSTDFKETVCVRSISEKSEMLPDDGYIWWKCGEKRIKGTPHKRSYYKCKTVKDNCSAKRQVMRELDNPSMLNVTYKKKHTHPPLKHTNNPINATQHVISHVDTNLLPAPLENEMRVKTHVVSDFDINLPAPFKNEMRVKTHVVSDFDINLPAPFENEMCVKTHVVSDFDINLPAPLENVDINRPVSMENEKPTIDAPQFFEFV